MESRRCPEAQAETDGSVSVECATTRTKQEREAVSTRTLPPTTALAFSGAPSNVALATHVAKKVATPLPPLRRSSSGRPSAAHCLLTRAARSAVSILQLFAGFLLFATAPCRMPRQDRVPRRTRNHSVGQAEERRGQFLQALASKARERRSRISDLDIACVHKLSAGVCDSFDFPRAPPIRPGPSPSSPSLLSPHSRSRCTSLQRA